MELRIGTIKYMDVIVIESAAFKAMLHEIERKIVDTVTKHVSPEDRFMTVKEVAEYTRFAPQWVTLRSAEIGAFQKGCGLRFKKSDVDAYMAKHTFKTK